MNANLQQGRAISTIQVFPLKEVSAVCVYVCVCVCVCITNKILHWSRLLGQMAGCVHHVGGYILGVDLFKSKTGGHWHSFWQIQNEYSNIRECKSLIIKKWVNDLFLFIFNKFQGRKKKQQHVCCPCFVSLKTQICNLAIWQLYYQVWTIQYSMLSNIYAIE